MKKENLFHAFEILVREYEKFPMPMHQHTFFELCYVAHGSGAFRSDVGTARFGPGAFILVKPGTKHVYELAEQTLLIYIRFSEDYLKPYFTQPECKALYAAPESKMDDWSDKEKMQLASAAKCILAECMSPFPDETLCQWWANGMIRLCVRRIQPSRAGKEVAATTGEPVPAGIAPHEELGGTIQPVRKLHRKILQGLLRREPASLHFPLPPA